MALKPAPLSVSKCCGRYIHFILITSIPYCLRKRIATTFCSCTLNAEDFHPPRISPAWSYTISLPSHTIHRPIEPKPSTRIRRFFSSYLLLLYLRLQKIANPHYKFILYSQLSNLNKLVAEFLKELSQNSLNLRPFFSKCGLLVKSRYDYIKHGFVLLEP